MPLDFLKGLFSDLDGFIEFRIIGKGKATQHFFTVKEVLDGWTDLAPRLDAANKQGGNVYFGVHPRTDKVGDAAHVSACRTLYADLDYKGDRAKKNCEPLKTAGLEPTYVVDSGHGYHLYWLLKEPIPHAEAERIMREIARVVFGDHVWDAPRIMRLPGFLNVKADPVPCAIVKASPDRRFNPSDFDVLATMPGGIRTTADAIPPKPVLKTVTPVSGNGNGHWFLPGVTKMLLPFWGNGHRHKLSLGLAGLMRKDGISEEYALAVVNHLSASAGDEEPEDRATAVRTTYSAPIGSVSGAKAVEEILQDRTNNFFTAYYGAVSLIPPPPVVRPKFPVFEPFSCVPPGSIFDKYLCWAYLRTDAPPQFHAAALMTVAAAALGNRAWVQYHGQKLFPNLYTLIAGPSSRFRKSTSIKLARDIAKAAVIPTFPNNATIEALYARMATEECEWKEEQTKRGEIKRIPTAWQGRPWGVIYHSEFASYLEETAKSYMAGSRSFLTDLYDGQVSRDVSSRETKSSGKYYIEDPAISMLCGVTFSGIKAFTGKSDIRGGFLARFLIVMPDPDHKNRFDDAAETPGSVPAAEIDLWNSVASAVTILKKFEGEFHLSRASARLHTEFDRHITGQIESVEGTPYDKLDAFFARLPAMVMKMAMVYAALSRPVGPPVIEEEDMDRATAFGRYVAGSICHFLDAVEPDDGNRELRYRNQALQAIRSWVKKHGENSPIRRGAWLQNSHLDSDQLSRCIDSLIAEGRVVCVRTRTSRKLSCEYVLNELHIASD